MYDLRITRTSSFIVAFILIVQASMLAWSAFRHSPVLSEVGHLPAGISHWQSGRFDLYRVNPPLVRMVAALPVILAAPATDWTSYSVDPLTRRETSVGIAFANSNGERTFWLYTLGRWACIPFSLLGAMICYLWARDLYGPWSGLAAMAMWCFCPNILGNGSLMMPDVPAAALGAAACYTFWRWLRHPTWLGSIAAGIVLGAAELTKTTLIVLIPLWPTLWLIDRLSNRQRMSDGSWLREGAMVLLRVLISVYILNLGYGFEGSFQRLGEYQFKSHTLAGSPADDRSFEAGNRFVDTWLATFPVPFPRNYVQGIDAQKLDFERGMGSYLRGQWSERGWWYFYLYAMAIKIPLGTLALILLATAISFFPCERVAPWRDEKFVLVPLALILALVSSQTGFSIHFRYVLPIFPFLFIWASKTFAVVVHRGRGLANGERQAGWIDSPAIPFQNEPSDASIHILPSQGWTGVLFRRVFRILPAAFLAWSIASSARNYPHSLSYFNELVGGSDNGHEHLLNSSNAWGQDLLYLKEWYDAHPEARPLYIAMDALVDPHLAGIDFIPALSAKASTGLDPVGDGAAGSLQPGWYAVDFNYLHVLGRPDNHNNRSHTGLTQYLLGLADLRRLQPVTIVGGTVYVFHVTSDETGLPPDDHISTRDLPIH